MVGPPLVSACDKPCQVTIFKTFLRQSMEASHCMVAAAGGHTESGKGFAT